MTIAPLTDIRTRRQDLLARMARDLIRFDALVPETDSIRALHGARYPMADIIMLIDEARALAFQEIVAREMSEP